MLSTELYDAADALGLALCQTAAVSAYQAASAALDADANARRLLDDLRERQAELARLQQSGLLPSQEQIGALRLSQSAVRSSTTAMDHLRTTNEVKAYLPMVATHITRALGTDYGALVAPASC